MFALVSTMASHGQQHETIFEHENQESSLSVSLSVPGIGVG